MLSIILLNSIPTNFEVFTFVMTVIQTLVVLVGVPFVLWQIRQQTAAINLQSETFHLTTYMQMMTESSRISEMILEHTDLIDFYDERNLPKNLSESWEQLDAKQRKHYLYLGRILSLQEQVYNLWKRGWIDKLDYQGNLTQLKEIIDLKKFSTWWPAMKPYYRQDFSAHVDSLQGYDTDKFFKIAMRKIKP
jgi:hypothetical protein